MAYLHFNSCLNVTDINLKVATEVTNVKSECSEPNIKDYHFSGRW